jgi:phosphate transport system protein
MSNSVFAQALSVLQEQLVQLGTQVELAVAHALTALERQDRALCSRIITADDAIDALRTEIEQHVFQLLTQQRPPGGRELRLLTAALVIARELERAGDGASGIATVLLRLFLLQESDPPPSLLAFPDFSLPRKEVIQIPEERVALENVLDLGREAQRVLHATMHAFATLDVEAARSCWQEDDVVDVRYHQLRHHLLTMLQGSQALVALHQDARIMQRVTYLFWIAHKLERLADHCGTICERILFIVEGDAVLSVPGE